ncbi:hypothetical protein CDAR_410211 [Caerostris darwini]|uniref:Uncharacterized protein n=1 Tax=Caerostris darwini TaxID=1538125 RepID=A0AAV4RDZ4_9ARAC|nr:hypothetical protein CDAR_410211 [Caerostris darwini]
MIYPFLELDRVSKTSRIGRAKTENFLIGALRKKEFCLSSTCSNSFGTVSALGFPQTILFKTDTPLRTRQSMLRATPAAMLTGQGIFRWEGISYPLHPL